MRHRVGTTSHQANAVDHRRVSGHPASQAGNETLNRHLSSGAPPSMLAGRPGVANQVMARNLGGADPVAASRGAERSVQRAPTVESMDGAWAQMGISVEGLKIVDFIARLKSAGPQGVPDMGFSQSKRFTFADFTQVSQTTAGRKWLDSKWRDPSGGRWGADQAIQGQHEWILTSSVGYVLATVETYHGGRDGDRWLMALDSLRTPTNEVVFNPGTVAGDKLPDRVTAANENPESYSTSTVGWFGGHQGAFYGPRPANDKERRPQDTYRQMSTYSASFHKKLDTLLKNHLNPKTNDLDGFLKALADFQATQVWGGDIPDLKDDTAARIRNDLMDSKTHTAQLYGRHSVSMGATGVPELTVSPFQNLAEIQQFAREAKQQNAQIMAHRVNALVQHGMMQTPIGGSTQWPSLPREEVYVTDENGMTVDDYTHLEADDEEQTTPYETATIDTSPGPARWQAPQDPIPADVLLNYGKARSAASDGIDQRIHALNGEVQQWMNAAIAAEQQALKSQVDQALAGTPQQPITAEERKLIESQATARWKEIEATYLALRSRIEQRLQQHGRRRTEIAAHLSSMESTVVTTAQLEALWADYTKALNDELDSYQSDVKGMFGVQ